MLIKVIISCNSNINNQVSQQFIFVNFMHMDTNLPFFVTAAVCVCIVTTALLNLFMVMFRHRQHLVKVSGLIEKKLSHFRHNVLI